MCGTIDQAVNINMAAEVQQIIFAVAQAVPFIGCMQILWYFEEVTWYFEEDVMVL